MCQKMSENIFTKQQFCGIILNIVSPILEDVEMIFKDYYKILGLDKTRISEEELRIAFREQAKKYHPDVNIGNRNSEERFKDINEAYRVLSNASSKRKYDRMWNTHIGRKKLATNYEESKREKDSLFSDFFNMFFGTDEIEKEQKKEKGPKKIPVRGENIETEINVSIQDAFYGLEKKIALRTVNRENENI